MAKVKPLEDYARELLGHQAFVILTLQQRIDALEAELEALKAPPLTTPTGPQLVAGPGA